VARTDNNDNQMIQAMLDGQFNEPLILWGYAHGIFPMGDPETGRIDWYSPDPRAIIELNKFHLSRTLRSTLRTGKFHVTLNQSFEKVIRACSDRASTWITERIIECFCQLHQIGYGHSVEVWKGTELAGGLYGVAIGGAFFGESMFHFKPDASKVALAGLVQQLRQQDFELLDIQYVTAHLIRFGACEIPREEYLHRLSLAIQKSCRFLRPGQQSVDFTSSDTV
jgi:leucyl/phenylalanyl-tRNA--protein transferase